LKFYRLFFAGLLTFSVLSNGTSLWLERSHIASGYGDFIIFYTGARIVSAGRGADLYDLSLQAEQQAPFGVSIREGPLPYNHLPYELLIFIPLARLPYLYAYLVWNVVNLALLCAVYRLLRPSVDTRDRIFLAGLMIAFYPTTVAFLHGQDSILSLFLIAAAYACLKASCDTGAGMILALGLYKPQLVLPFAALFALKRRWGALWGFGLSAFGVAAVSLAMVGGKGFADYLQLISWMDKAQYTIHPPSMANIRGLASLLGVDTQISASHLVLVLIYVAFLVWTVLLWKGGWNPSKTEFDLAFAHTTVVALLISHHLYPHDLALLLIPVLLTYSSVTEDRGRAPWQRRAFYGLLLLLYISPGAMWLIKENLFALFALLLICLAVVVSAEFRCRSEGLTSLVPS
jgi:hypothetical protein